MEYHVPTALHGKRLAKPFLVGLFCLCRSTELGGDVLGEGCHSLWQTHMQISGNTAGLSAARFRCKLSALSAVAFRRTSDLSTHSPERQEKESQALPPSKTRLRFASQPDVPHWRSSEHIDLLAQSFPSYHLPNITICIASVSVNSHWSRTSFPGCLHSTLTRASKLDLNLHLPV